jgi:hypothetical protein
VVTVEMPDGVTLVPGAPSASPTAVTPGGAAVGPMAGVGVVGAAGAAGAATAGATAVEGVGAVTAGVGPRELGAGAAEFGGTVVELAPAVLRIAAMTSSGATGSTVAADAVPRIVGGGVALLEGAVPVDGDGSVDPAAGGAPVGTATPV